ncbi:unannotated protein [freshwater metagenome]|uniref:Unannotated protein n=1 Tax=freshwater metagenome TaxID=449393 RepID=A0A6J7H7G1_9ZZZZ
MAKMLATTGRFPSEGEQRSWRASLPVLTNDLIDAGLRNVEVLVEYQLPLTSKRVDAVLAGVHPLTGLPSYVIVELKQWHEADLFESNPSLVQIAAYGPRPVQHPLEQAEGYRQYMLDFLPGLHDRQDSIWSVAYLHNATEFGVADLREYPEQSHLRMFTGEKRSEFRQYLLTLLDPSVSGAAAADELMGLAPGPSKQLLVVAADEIQNREQFVLLGEQKLAFDLVLHEVNKARRADHKSVVVISGGPGSGKSVIALSLMGELARQGHSVLHATGSRSFTQTLRMVAGKGSTRVKSMFKYFNSFMEAEPNSLDVLILDEAHRIRETSANRYTKASLRVGRPQLDELISAARVPVFLLDQHQVVRPGELGSVEEIEAFAKGRGLEVHEISLDDQFRCGGSAAFMYWVQCLLGLEGDAPVQWEGDERFTLDVCDSPEELMSRLALHRDAGFGARATAGYCWPWSDPNDDGSLVEDVSIGSWSMPWNLKGDRGIGGAPPSALWATDPAGFGQIGCVYTAQGFEYDWNGVIFGPDLVWRSDHWEMVRGANKDPDFRSLKSVIPEEFDRLIKNVYKVLLTRGMIGTYLYSVDPETQQLLRKLTA